jgi:NAD(P)-dependent dehydrogenase (short-subunit alcohol dehydrogenase family)
MHDKVVIVTGASRGIGEAIARSLALAGAKVMMAARKAESLESAARLLCADGGEAQFMACHVGKSDQLHGLFDATLKAFGKVDVVINNAGTNVHFGPLLQVEDGAWQKTFEVNLKGAFELSRIFARHVMDRGTPGAVVNVASVLGMGAAPMQGVYGMTKASVISMTQTLAVELGGASVRVNAIAPGLIRTRLSEALHSNQDLVNRVVERTPLGRLGEPADVAGTALFLASNASRFITGQTLVVDGGLTLSVF